MPARMLLLLALLFSQTALAVDTLDKIRKSGVITIAHPANTPPFSYPQGGEPTGYSINLCRQVVDNIALQLGMPQIRINWRPATTSAPPLPPAGRGRGWGDILCGKIERGTLMTDIFTMAVEDDGIGINKQVYGSPGEHIGLSIMRERASRLGGKLQVESEPGEGTRIVLELNQPASANNLT